MTMNTNKTLPFMKPMLADGLGRHIDYARVSITDRCMLRCLYCMPPNGMPYIPHSEILRYEELLRVCRVLAELGVSRFKITGGEPLCRFGAADFIRCLKALPEVDNVTLTTNGLLLGQLFSELHGQIPEALDGLTVSLDAISQNGFLRITRKAFPVVNILAAMAQARANGLQVKINTVPIRGANEDEILPLARFALENDYIIRFIELMPVGLGRSYQGVSREEIVSVLEKEFGSFSVISDRLGNGPAVYMRHCGSSGVIGFISPLSHTFCGQCNRIRLTSTGFLKTCLHHNSGLELKPWLRPTEPAAKVSDSALAAQLLAAIRRKPNAHAFAVQAPPATAGPEVYMHSIGG